MAAQERDCRLLAGASGALAQAALATGALAALAARRSAERPPRPLDVWALDASKQGAAQLAAHATGLAVAVGAHRRAAEASECAWYLVVFGIDTCFGTALSILLHRLALRLAAARAAAAAAAAAGSRIAPAEEPWAAAVAACGDYGGPPPSRRRWALQAAEFAACVVLARLACGGVLLSFAPAAGCAAASLDALFAGRPALELAAVMLGGPLLMNAAQVVAQDAALRWRGGDGDYALALPLS